MVSEERGGLFSMMQRGQVWMTTLVGRGSFVLMLMAFFLGRAMILGGAGTVSRSPFMR